MNPDGLYTMECVSSTIVSAVYPLQVTVMVLCEAFVVTEASNSILSIADSILLNISDRAQIVDCRKHYQTPSAAKPS